jgi:hypothetical protein
VACLNPLPDGLEVARHSTHTETARQLLKQAETYQGDWLHVLPGGQPEASRDLISLKNDGVVLGVFWRLSDNGFKLARVAAKLPPFDE